MCSDNTVKLIDFGLSKQYYKIEKNEIVKMASQAGTCIYMAPEVIDQNYT